MTHGSPVNPQIIEVVDAVLLPLLSIMAGFTALHVFHLWNQCRQSFPGPGGFWKCIRGIYYERKPSVAIFVFTMALLARFSNFWHWRHLSNHDLPEDIFAANSEPIFLGATAVLIIAIVCWIRNVSPIPVPNWVWMLVIVLDVSWAVYMAH